MKLVPLATLVHMDIKAFSSRTSSADATLRFLRF
ncbi:hypothetical protein T09_7742 [Trichinella sp. T9]|nr:hypothetical protein T09_7742 [Trichinella sp. T9]